MRKTLQQNKTGLAAESRVVHKFSDAGEEAERGVCSWQGLAEGSFREELPREDGVTLPRLTAVGGSWL